MAEKLMVMETEIRVSVALLGLGLIGAGLYEVYRPLCLIYCGVVLIFLANNAGKENERK